MGYLRLQPADAKLLNGVVGSSFSASDLATFFSIHFPEFAGDVVWSQPFNATVFHALDAANRNGRLDAVLIAMCEDRPHRPDLRDLALRMSRLPGWSAGPNLANGLDLEPALQKVTVSADPFLNTAALAKWIVAIERQVCLIGCGPTGGTGFLVGPDLVLTCHHVVERFLTGQVPAEKVRLRFDYRASPSGQLLPVDPAATFALDPAWQPPSSPPADADLTLVGEPPEDRLDYALLKVYGAPGFQVPVGGHAARGWVDLSADPATPPHHSPMLIVQHPASEAPPPAQEPLKIAFATPGFDRPNANGTRLLYAVSTRRGSSGSPVFDARLDAVALHHNRGDIDPAAPQNVRNNRGIPLGRIRRHLPAATRALLVAPG